MTDEEKAMTQFKNTICAICEDKDVCDVSILDCACYDSTYSPAYLDGLAEGRKEKWHDLRKDPDDLPKHSGEYWCKWEDGAYSTEHYFADSGFGSYVIAWCELPKYEEIR